MLRSNIIHKVRKNPWGGGRKRNKKIINRTIRKL